MQGQGLNAGGCGLLKTEQRKMMWVKLSIKQNLYVETLSPNMTALGIGFLGDK